MFSFLFTFDYYLVLKKASGPSKIILSWSAPGVYNQRIWDAFISKPLQTRIRSQRCHTWKMKNSIISSPAASLVLVLFLTIVESSSDNFYRYSVKRGKEDTQLSQYAGKVTKQMGVGEGGTVTVTHGVRRIGMRWGEKGWSRHNHVIRSMQCSNQLFRKHI